MEDEFYIDYARLDEIQRSFVDRKVNRSMVVTGKAGSGKSVIALHKAKQVSKLGSYAVIVFTKSLKKYFRDGMRALGLSNDYYYQEWKKLGDARTKVKYLIVDECQDFSSEEIAELRSYGEICFFFGDTDQSIMSFRSPLQSVRQTADAIGVEMDRLYKNYRLTIENAVLAEQVGDLDDLAEICERHGAKPSIFKESNIDKQLDKIIAIIKNQSLSNVGILMRFNSRKTALSRVGNEKLSVEYVKDYFESKGVTVEYKYNMNGETAMDLDFHSTNPKILTWWCAKGLQFKDVFLPMCEITHEDNTRAALYVAVSRTSERLYLTYSNQLFTWFPDESSDVYANPIAEDEDNLPF